MGKFRNTTDVIPAVYKEGERFAQLLILPVPDMQMVESDTLAESERGENGYGSTGNAEISAPEDSQSLPENKDESTNSENTETGSGEA